MTKKLYNFYFLVSSLLFLGSVINFIIKDVLDGFIYLSGAAVFTLLGYLNKRGKQ
jgi:hypothetical protein